jgi:hypothetical protein
MTIVAKTTDTSFAWKLYLTAALALAYVAALFSLAPEPRLVPRPRVATAAPPAAAPEVRKVRPRARIRTRSS